MPYGQPPGQGPHQGMMHMPHGVPYPYVMMPMGAPYVYVPQHPDMGNHHPGEMGIEPPHYRGPMMQFPYGMPHPHMPPHIMQMQPMPQYMPQGNHMMSRRESLQSVHSVGSRTEHPKTPPPPMTAPPVAPPTVVVPGSTADKPVVANVSPSKPVSRRMPIIDPVTGQEISFNPPVKPAASVPSIPASALTPADVVLGLVDPSFPNKTTPSSLADAQTKLVEHQTPPLVVESSETPLLDVGVPAAPSAVIEPSSTSSAGALRKPLMKLKNAPLAKPVKVVAAQPVSPPLPNGMKQLNKMKNKPLERKPSSSLPVSGEESSVLAPTPPLNVVVHAASMSSSISKPASKLSRMANKTISVPRVVPSVVVVTEWPVTREMFLRFLPLHRPDRFAPSSVNVFPSELLGLRTAPHGDPGLSRAASRRGGVGLQKSVSLVSSTSVGQWRSGGGKLGRTLSRQQSAAGRGGRVLVNRIVRPSESGFKIIDQSSLSEKDKLRRQVMALLNKITVDSFAGITERIAEIEITQPWQMDVVIGLIFDKAVAEHHYSELYADMCKRLRNTWPELTGVDAETGEAVPVTFTRAIIEKCQAEFDAMPETLEPTEEDVARARGDPTDVELIITKKKNRILGNMKFIAQLFLMRILSSRSIRSVVEQLLFRTEAPEEHYIECICILLHNIGATLYQTDSGRAYVDQFVDRMEELCGKESYGKRIKFLMKDVIEAASTGWEGKHGGARMVTAAKSKEAVRKETQQELSRSNSSKFARTPTPAATPPRQVVTAVLHRPAEQATRRPSIPEEEEEDEDEDDDDSDVSEYAPGSEDEEGFTRVTGPGQKRQP